MNLMACMTFLCLSNVMGFLVSALFFRDKDLNPIIDTVIGIPAAVLLILLWIWIEKMA